MENLTVIIVTYKTPEKIILDCLKSIDSKIKVLIIENSDNFYLKDIILRKFQNVEIYCTGKNLGYGSGNNFGISKSKTDYILILNPDVVCDKSFFSEISNVINKASDFSIIGCQYINDNIFMPAGFFDYKQNEIFKKNFLNKNFEYLTNVEWVTGCSMIINLKKFLNKKIFDENFFLYFEEFDLCKSLIKNNEKIYTSKKLKVHHLGFKSSFEENSEKKRTFDKLREWHWMWSTFYFYKKNYSYFFAFKKIFGKFLKSFFKILFYSILLNKVKKEKYLYRFLGILNAILNRPSYYRGDAK